MFPPLFTWGHTMVEGMKIKATSSKRPHACTAALSAPNPAAPPLTPASARDSWTLTGKSGPVSCGVTAPSSWVLVHKVLSVPSKSLFPVLCKFWQLYGGVNGDLLKEDLCHIQVCWIPEPFFLWQSTAELYPHRRHSNTVQIQSLWGPWVLVHTRFV